MRRPRTALLRTLRAALLLGAVLLYGCQGIAPSEFSGDVDVLLSQGEAFAAHLQALPADRISDAEVLALGYLERARLGLGSPFRLIEYALRDPDIPPADRERLAYAILAHTLDSRGYAIDPAVLEVVRLNGAAAGVETGVHQLRLIERAVAAAPSPASGERAVRLAYRIAEAEGTVSGDPESVVAYVAALLADRRRARGDAIALLRTAAARGVEPLALLHAWRDDLRFAVEGPALDPLSAREEAVVAERGPQLALAVRTLAQRLSVPGSRVGLSDRTEPRGDSYLEGGAARRLWKLAVSRNYPPQAPVAVAVAINRDRLLSRPGLSAGEREARERFADGAWNEERLVSGAALLRRTGEGRGVRLALTKLQAAMFLRVWNQEEPWIPGDPAPAARDLVARFGLGAVEFGASVPEAWKPYYLTVLARGLADLQRVLPTASLRGLEIRVAPLPDDAEALALHEPRTRTLLLPPKTGAGTLAHEIAHDLDWQLARRRYGVSGGYATDLAVRTRRHDRIAASLSNLAASLMPPGARDETDEHDTRPAEVFARGTDWFAAAALAREGRTGGYLTSYQDAVLTGYGSTRGPDVTGAAVPSLLGILDAIAPVDAGLRAWALEAYGPSRTLSPHELVLAITQSGAGLPPADQIHAVRRARERALASLNSVSCRLTSAAGMRRLIAAQRNLIEVATAAAARGAVIEGAREMAEGATIDAWLRWRLYGAPEPVDSVAAELAPALEELLYLADSVNEGSPAAAVSVFSGAPAAPLCGRNPFTPGMSPPWR